MKAIKEFATIQSNGDLLIQGLPIQEGQKVEVLILVNEESLLNEENKELSLDEAVDYVLNKNNELYKRLT